MDDEIIELAKNMPQFDVSEALTQRILADIEAETSQLPQVIEGIQFKPLGIAVAAIIIVIMPFDSLEGVLSWSLGLAALLAMQGLIGSASRAEQLS